MPEITPNLWFDTESKEAAEFYVSVFPNSRILLGGTDRRRRRARPVRVAQGQVRALVADRSDRAPAPARRSRPREVPAGDGRDAGDGEIDIAELERAAVAA